MVVADTGPIRNRVLRLQQALEVGSLAITAEVMPPRGGDPRITLAHARALSGLVHAVNVTDGSRAVMRMSSLAVCRLLLDAGIEPVWQLACRDRNRIGLQADLLGAHALGIRNLLCLTGDPVRAGDQVGARSVHEFESVRLLQQVQAFNQGIDPVQGLLPDGPTSLFAGAAANPADEGISIAAEQVATYAGIAQGVHLMAVKAEERIPLILERAGINSRC